MKKYNEVIQIEVEVDVIAQQLHDILDTKHKDLVTETIIDLALKNKDVNYIYQAINGITFDVDFKVDEKVMCDLEVWDYKLSYDNKTEPDRLSRPMGVCIITAIDKYADRKLQVNWEHTSSEGTITTKKEWVNHRRCSSVIDATNKLPTEE